jgi:spore coat polysaccharide biosynthesis protein SpsF (cytidylyltransferase family)
MSHWRLTVDTAEDLDLVRRVYASLDPPDPGFDYRRLVECLEAHPEWSEINRHVIQRGT